MKQAKPVFVCQECGSQSPKWQGRCHRLRRLELLVEERAAEAGGASLQGHRYALPGSAAQGANRYSEIEAS